MSLSAAGDDLGTRVTFADFNFEIVIPSWAEASKFTAMVETDECISDIRFKMESRLELSLSRGSADVIDF